MSEPNTTARPRWHRIRWLLRQAERVFALIGLGMVLYFTCFDLSRMVSGSMSPTLEGTDWKNGDWVLTERVSYWLRRPRRWEVITFRNPEGNLVMKRVVGLPGEHVKMQSDGQILIDGELVERPPELAAIHYLPYGTLVFNQSAACKDGYYVLGDFSRDSDDSRFNGPVRPEQLIGRAWLIVSPDDRRGFVH